MEEKRETGLEEMVREADQAGQKEEKRKREKKRDRILLITLSILFIVVPMIISCLWGSITLYRLIQEDVAAAAAGEDRISVDREEREEEVEDSGLTVQTKEKWLLDTGAENATVLIYLMGSDLESEGGCASNDLIEILNADLKDTVNVVIQTGGAKKWQDERISADSVQRFSVEDGELVLQQDLGLISMVEQETLTDFIRWGTESYPADRSILILWNHGGGTMAGYGYDEHFEGALYLSDLAEALEDAGTYFDFIGFDACMMATIETAYALYPYADYLVASEEMEPGSGWFYVSWLNLLAENPGVSMGQLGERIVKDYLHGPHSLFWDSATLTVLDLEGIPEVYQALCEFMAEANEDLEIRGYYTASLARAGAKSYGEGEYDQIDIVDYMKKTIQSGAGEVIDSIEEIIVYHDSTISNTNGLAMYFPYDYPEYYQMVLEEMDSVGMENEEYRDFFNHFVSFLVYGNERMGHSSSPMEQLTGYDAYGQDEDYSSSSWYQEDVEGQDFPMLETMENGELYLTEKDGYYYLQLTDEEWETITYLELQVFIDDGEGYLDLGGDNVYWFDEEGDLLVDFDYTWVALDGQIVPFYAVEEGEKADGSWYTYGIVPAELTKVSDGSKQDVEILVYWDDDHDDGYVTGYRSMYTGGISVAERNLMQFEDGDTLDFFCDYYTYDGEYEASYYFGDTLTVSGELTVSYEELEEYTTDICYYLEDIFRNEYWTETITLYFE
ncbi:MAG: hypothetical protein IJP31_05300 [Lachnospiraceae bacterium]|nr:hypothetical protein [Lachnospiraceae bacterium]